MTSRLFSWTLNSFTQPSFLLYESVQYDFKSVHLDLCMFHLSSSTKYLLLIFWIFFHEYFNFWQRPSEKACIYIPIEEYQCFIVLPWCSEVFRGLQSSLMMSPIMPRGDSLSGDFTLYSCINCRRDLERFFFRLFYARCSPFTWLAI